MPTAKSEVVSVRVEPRIKAALQAASDREIRSPANRLEVMVVASCRSQRRPFDAVPDDTLQRAKPKF